MCYLPALHLLAGSHQLLIKLPDLIKPPGKQHAKKIVSFKLKHTTADVTLTEM